MLTGADLLAKVKGLGDVSKSDLVRSCGYVSSTHEVAWEPAAPETHLEPPQT